MVWKEFFRSGSLTQPPVVIIAELGVNHNGNLETALQLIEAAADCGADVVKIQAFDPDEMVLKGTATAQYQKMAGESATDQYTLLQRLTLAPEQIHSLRERAKAKKLHFCASVFDLPSAELMLNLGLDLFKIPSGELTNLPLIKAVAGFARPLLLSTGMATLGEVEAAVAAASGAAASPALALLHCVSSYPAPYSSLNLRVIPTLKAAFQKPVGYSDHTLGYEAAIVAVALGAVIIEKHFTLDRNLPGPDHQASLNPAEFRRLVQEIRQTEAALGSGIKTVTAVERETRQLTRKSVVARVDIAKGTPISAAMLTVKRPGTGLAPQLLEELIGQRAARDIPRDTLLQWSDLTRAAKEGEAGV